MMRRLFYSIQFTFQGQLQTQNYSKGWGSSEWVCVYASSTATTLMLGTLHQGSYAQVQKPPILMDSSYSLMVGNHFSSNQPLTLIHSINIYKAAYSFTSSPFFIHDIIQSTPGFSYFNPPISKNKFLHLSLRPSYIQSETILDLTTNSFHGVNGIDLTPLANAISVSDGFSFDGSQQISVSGLSLSLFTGTIVLSLKWTISPSTIFQTLFEEPSQNYRFQVSPLLGRFQFHFQGGDYFSSQTFSVSKLFSRVDLSGQWNEVALSFSPLTSASCQVMLFVNGVSFSANMSVQSVDVSSLTIGSSFTGIMQNFIIYSFPLGLESLSSIPTGTSVLIQCSESVQPITILMIQLIRVRVRLVYILACHPLCSDCRDSSNSFCGSCMTPAILSSTAGEPSTCIVLEECHESCSSCTGPQQSECSSCAQNYYQTFLDGATGQCTDNCAQFNEFYEGRENHCVLIPLLVSSSLQLIQQEGSFSLFLSFTQPILFESLDNSQFQVSISGFQSEDFDLSFPSLSSQVVSSIQIEIQFFRSISSDLIFSAEFTPSSSKSLSSNFILPPTFEASVSDSVSFHYVRSDMALALQITPLIAGGLSLACIVGLAIMQCFFQISAQILWGLINFDQLVFFAPFMSLSLPPLLFLIFQTLSFAVGDLYFITYLYNASIGKQFSSLDESSFTPNFQAMGFSTHYLMIAAGPFLLIFLVQLLLIPIYLLLGRDCYPCKERRAKFQRFCRCLKWGLLIRSLIQASLQILLFASINLAILSLQQFTLCAFISSLISVCLLLCFLLLPFGLIRVLTRPPFELGCRSSNTYLDFGELFKRLNFQESFLSKHYFFWFLLRRYLLVGILLFLSWNGKLQLALSIFLSLSQIIILGRVRPFKDKIDNSISIFNEICLLAIYALMLSIEQLKGDRQEKAIWAICGIIGFVNLINFLLLIVLKSIECKKKCLLRRQEKKDFKERQMRMKKKMNLPQNNDSTNFSLFSPAARGNRTRQVKPSTFNQGWFMCGIERHESRATSARSPRVRVDNDMEYQLTDDPKTIRIIFKS